MRGFPSSCATTTEHQGRDNQEAIRGALTTVMAVLFFWGLAHVPLAQAIALAFIAPLIAIFLAAAVLGETVGPRTIGASLIAFAGVIIIFIGQAQADLGQDALRGSIAILVSAVCYAVNIILMRQQALGARPQGLAVHCWVPERQMPTPGVPAMKG